MFQDFDPEIALISERDYNQVGQIILLTLTFFGWINMHLLEYN